MRRDLMFTFAVLLVLAFPINSPAAGPSTKPSPLSAQTSRYNRGNAPGRYRDAGGKLRRFALRRGEASLYDGGGREIGRVRQPVLLNIGADKSMDVAGDGRKRSFAWAWDTEAGSGWIGRDELIDAPPPDVDPARNPRPPRESDKALTIDAAAGREKLAGLRHVDSRGEIPTGGGNKGEHYAGRNPGPRDYVYLLLAVPNVQRGGVAKDSISDFAQFIPAVDERGNSIAETMTMYRNGDLSQPVPVTFLYGREKAGEAWGWIARANVGDR